MNFTYLDNVPALSTDLVDEVYKSVLGENIFVVPNDTYYIYKATPKLQDFLSNYFDKNLYNFRVQCIRHDIGIHVDHNRNTAINYIVDCGGQNVETTFYDDFGNITETLVIEKCRWHSLKVDTKHSVSNVKSMRLAVTVHIPWNKL